MNYSGILIIDKPAGWTSHDVIAKLRGTLRQKRVGHGGTLDPMATGVLPVFIGRATRAAEFCENAEKEYVAGIKLGIVTDTQDITGNVLTRQSALVSRENFRNVLAGFLGKQQQIPPMYSAIKKDGKKLYELARRGVEVERKPRAIEINELELAEPPPAGGGDDGSDFYMRVSCSKGTYIRTLCHDIGAALGCGAALSYLRRVRAGVFTIDMAHPLDEILATVPDILPADSIFSQYASVTLSAAEARKAKNGALRELNGCVADGKYRFYSPDGEFLLFGEAQNGKLKPIKSFFEV